MLVVVLPVFAPPSIWAGSVSLAWNPSASPNVTDYGVFYGLASGDYTSYIDAGTNCSVTVSDLAAGLTYYFCVLAYDSNQDASLPSNELIDNVTTVPAITLQPVDQSVAAGAYTYFRVTVDGAPPFTYQWFVNGATIAAGTDKVLELANVSDADAGNYSVVITNSAGSVTSIVAALTVIDPPVIRSQPVSQSVPAGAYIYFRAAANGTSPFTYQWFDNGIPIAEGINKVLPLANVSDADAGNYSVVIANSGGSVTSSVATLTVINPPVIMSQPVPQSVAAGANVSFWASVYGTPPFTYQWFDNGTPIAAGVKVLFLANVSSANAGNYYVTVQNAAGSVTSAVAALTITTTNAFESLAGAYNGLFYQTNDYGLPDISAQSAGMLNNCVVDTNGLYNAAIYLAGFNYPLAGALDADGNDSEVVSCAVNGPSNLTVTLHLDMTGITQVITGCISNMDAGNPWAVPLVADLANNGLPLSTEYFILDIPPQAGAPPDSPQGYALINTTTPGVASLSGVLSDGSQISQTVPIASNGTFPLYLSLYNGAGLVEGWIDLASGQPAGLITWICPGGVSPAVPYLQGFTNVVNVE
jgi:hypothetical protein